MLIALDAGHYLGTPGKRCLKSIDPGETREWVLNSRIADKVQAILADYQVDILRLDDPTGQTDVTLQERTDKANRAKADLYLSIHANAGINGGSGGGIVMYAYSYPDEESIRVRDTIYRYTVSTTGLRGNRANPLALANFHVLRESDMPAVLGEFGFMDSTTDTPIILTEEFADHCADGIAAALVALYELEKKTMSYDQFKAYMEQYRRELGQQKASPWAVPYIAQAIDAGLIADKDGSIDRPRDFVTREELATSLAATVKT